MQFAAQKIPQYSLNLDTSQWISPALPSSNAYFRWEGNLNGNRSRTYLVIAATEKFDLYVNGQVMARENATGELAAGIYDISRELRTGRNLLAVKVSTTLRWKTPALAARIEVQHENGSVKTFYSDSSWKTTTLEHSQFNGTRLWYDPHYLDTGWNPAKTSNPPELELHYTGPPEQLFQQPPEGMAFAVTMPRHSTVTLTQNIDFEQDHLKDAWLVLYSDSDYRFSLNGYTSDPLPGSAVRTQLHPLKRFLVPGLNRIGIQLSGASTLPVFSAGVWLNTSQGTLAIPLSHNWQFSGKGQAFSLSPAASTPEPGTLLPARQSLNSNLYRDLQRWLPEFLKALFVTATLSLSTILCLELFYRRLHEPQQVHMLRACSERSFFWGSIASLGLLTSQLLLPDSATILLLGTLVNPLFVIILLLAPVLNHYRYYRQEPLHV